MSRISDIHNQHERTKSYILDSVSDTNQTESARTHEIDHMHYDSGFESGVEFERKRIIKLIETNTDVDVISNRMVFTSRNWVTPERLIQLIEREQK